MPRPASLLRVLLHHAAQRLDPGRQAEPLEARRHLGKSHIHSSETRRRQSGLSRAKSLHGVAFLSWNQHPEPTGSRRATPLLLFQQPPGHRPDESRHRLTTIMSAECFWLYERGNAMRITLALTLLA